MSRLRFPLPGLIAAVGLMVAGPAMAEVLSAWGTGHSRAAACQDAKRAGERQVRNLSYASVRGSRDPSRTLSVTQFGYCECSREGDDDWACTVDVYYHRD